MDGFFALQYVYANMTLLWASFNVDFFYEYLCISFNKFQYSYYLLNVFEFQYYNNFIKKKLRKR